MTGGVDDGASRFGNESAATHRRFLNENVRVGRGFTRASPGGHPEAGPRSTASGILGRHRTVRPEVLP